MSTSLKMTGMLIVILAEAGCGLPDSYFLQPPAPSGQPPAGVSGQTFQFANPDHTTDFNVSFTGFELYYRFYNVGDTININAYDPTNPADPVTQLSNNGFWPVRSATDTASSQSIPLINVQALVNAGALGSTNAVFSVQVNITGSQVSPGPGTYVIGSTSTEIRRDVIDPASSFGYKSFSSNYYPLPSGDSLPNYNVALDADFQKITSINSGQQQAWVALYALSYGLITLSTPTRSTPVYLGYALVNITIP